MFLYDMARKANRYRKTRKKIAAGRYLSPVRRIERTAALRSGRYIAMTFDDGPSAAFTNPPVNGCEKGLTLELLDILSQFGAKGTFDVIGTTELNYPDSEGKADDFTWSGVKYDHYPNFGNDKLAGVKNQLELASKIVKGGHELANHGYRHIIFGPMKLVYGKRANFITLREVINDLNELHTMVNNELGYQMKLSRPPHYIDKIPDGYTSYDAYRYMGYNYLAASFDGGGWKPSCGDYRQDVKAMVDPIKAALESNINSLNGQIIFQKDGFNMSHQTPVADALYEALEMLSQAGYKVITASELIAKSPFEDIDDTDPVFEQVRDMSAAGYIMGYKNNTFQPDRVITCGELALMATPPEILLSNYRDLIDNVLNAKSVKENAFKDVRLNNPYRLGIEYITGKGWLRTEGSGSFRPDDPLTLSEFADFLDNASDGINIEWSPEKFSGISQNTIKPGLLRRREVIKALAQLNLRYQKSGV